MPRVRSRRAIRRLVTIISVVSALFVTLLSGTSLAAGSSYYVDRDDLGCSSSGPGSASVPFCTIAKGVSQLQPGDTLYVGNGTYPETIKPQVSGAAGSPITITAWPGRSPIVGTGVPYGAFITGRSYVTVSNLTFRDTTADGINVTASDHISIIGNSVSGAGQQIAGQTAPGISLKSNTADSTVTGNNSSHNDGHGILVTTGSTRNTISGNEVSFNAVGFTRDATGIDILSPGNDVLRNVAHDNEDSGIQFYVGGNNGLAALNVTYNNGDHGIDNFNVSGGRLISNTVYRNCASGINVEGTSNNYLVVNNVAVDNAVYPAYNGIPCTRRGGNIGIYDSAPASTLVDHNLVHLSKAGTVYAFGVPYSSLAAMQGATGQETHGVQGDPRFLNPGGWDLRIGAGSPAIDRGDSAVAGAQSNDILGAGRKDDPSTPNTNATGPRLYDDLGAYEFQPTAVPLPPTARLTVTPSSGTAPLQVTADGSTSTDPSGQGLTYRFEWGDGAVSPTGSVPSATHTYTNGGTYAVKLTVTNAGGVTNSTTRTVTVASGPAYVARIGTAASTAATTTASLTLTRAVRAGNMVVVTTQGSNQALRATDDLGNTYATATSRSDSTGTRLTVLYGVATRALPVGKRITVTFGTATPYRMVADELAGVTSVDRAASATGRSTSFSSGATASTRAPRELALGILGVTGGFPAVSWTGGWHPAAPFSSGTNTINRAYQVLTSAGPVTGSGYAYGTWTAAVVTFKP